MPQLEVEVLGWVCVQMIWLEEELEVELEVQLTLRMAYPENRDGWKCVAGHASVHIYNAQTKGI